MRTRHILTILILGPCWTFSQSTLLDSIFYQIPFTTDLRTTKILLTKKSDFEFSSADTISVHGRHISYLTSVTNPIPNKATKTEYTKGNMIVLVDGKMPDYCIKFYSSITFMYKNKSLAKKDFDLITKYLDRRLKPRLIAGLVNLKNERYGYELYLSDTRQCNYVTVTKELDSETHCVTVRYH
jgi:hypothetical protein